MNKKQSNLEYKKGYGENYANLRKTEYNGKGKDFTVRELEKLIGVSYTAINLIEKEKREPTVEQVLAYKHFFGVSLDYLTGETDATRVETAEICKVTGLTEEAINELHKTAEFDEDCKIGTINYLSKLLSCRDFYNFVDLIRQLDDAINEKEYIKRISAPGAALNSIVESDYSRDIKVSFIEDLIPHRLNLKAYGVAEDYKFCHDLGCSVGDTPIVNITTSLQKDITSFKYQSSDNQNIIDYHCNKAITKIIETITEFNPQKFIAFSKAMNKKLSDCKNIKGYFESQDEYEKFCSFILNQLESSIDE